MFWLKGLSSFIFVILFSCSSAWSAGLTLNGKALLGTIGVADVKVNITGIGSTYTDAGGNFSLNGLQQGTRYTVTASKTNYSFARLQITASPSSVRDVRFVGTCSSGRIIIDGECWSSDPNRRDRDDDGLTDYEESVHGTSPTNPDTDEDDVGDEQEVIDGSSPIDRGSLMPVLSTKLCADWNGFLGMYNIFEHVNLSRSQLKIYSQVYNSIGNVTGANLFTLDRGRQFDLLTHEAQGFAQSNVGRICSTHDQDPGDMTGRMVYYKPNNSGSGMQFAFAMPMNNPVRGSQWVSFNTFQPSLDRFDENNFVANWIQLTNLSELSQSGVLTFYDISGSVLSSRNVGLAGNSRADFSGHQFGRNIVGLVQWSPSNPDAAFELRNIRYFYDNPGNIPSFVTAFQLGASVGSGQMLTAPLDTRSATSVVELSNTRDIATNVTLNIYEYNGVLRKSMNMTLGPKASAHIIADSFLNNTLGRVSIDAVGTESVIATVMQYGRTKSLGIQYLYGIKASQALGTELTSSYNTFLEQGCRLLVTNTSNDIQSFTARMVNSSGRSLRPRPESELPGDYLPLRREILVFPNGAVDFDMCSQSEEVDYGTVTVSPAKRNTLVGTVIRIGKNNSYRFPTLLRQ